MSAGLPPDPAGQASAEEQIAALKQAAAVPGADVIGISGQLTGLSGQLSGEAGGAGDAAAAQSAAVDVLRGANPPQSGADYLRVLGEALHTLFARLEDAGRPDDAVAAAREAIMVYGQAGVAPGASVELVVNQLTTLSKQLRSVPADALSAAQTVVQILTSTAQPQPSPEQQTSLADAIQNVAARLIDAGRGDDAVATAAQSAVSYADAALQLRAAIADVAGELTDIAQRLTIKGLTAQAAAAQHAAQDALLGPPPAGQQPPPPDPAATGDVVVAQAQVAALDATLRAVLDGLSALRVVASSGGLAGTVAYVDAMVGGLAPGRFCGYVDPPRPSGGNVALLVFGAIEHHWDIRQLRVSVTSWANPDPDAPHFDPVRAIQDAFRMWETVGPPGQPGLFSFVFVDPDADKEVEVFFRDDPSQGLGQPGVTLALTTSPPQDTKVQFAVTEAWTVTFLFSIALHEIGHVLGLSHSDDPSSLMFPVFSHRSTIDAETRQALLLAYAQEPQQQLRDRATTGRPAMAMVQRGTFGGPVSRVPQMVWKGTGADQGIWHAELDGSWSSQERVPGVGTSHSPALTGIALPEDPATGGLLMAWKGAGNDRGLYWTRHTVAQWETQRPVENAGTIAGPSLATVNGRVFMAWRGLQGDPQIYWSEWDGKEHWSPQTPVKMTGTIDGPCLVSFRNMLYLFWKGLDGDDTAYFSFLDPSEDHPQFLPQKQITFKINQSGVTISEPIGTTTAPTAAVRGNSILLAWKGAEGDSQIWLSLFDSTEFSGQWPLLDAGTSVGPGALDADGITLLAWKGKAGDNTIWWKHV